MSKKIGIFAGTFDPVHDGHLAFARAALAQGLERIMFLPEPRPRRKQGVHALEHRIAMVQLAVAHEADMGVITLEQARFTAHETLPVLQARFAGYKLVLLFGDDVVAHIAGWPNVDKLLTDTELCIASRQQGGKDIEAALKTLQKTSNLTIQYQLVEPGHETITSSKIRLALKRGADPEGLNQKVASYVKKHRLYTSATEAASS